MLQKILKTLQTIFERLSDELWRNSGKILKLFNKKYVQILGKIVKYENLDNLKECLSKFFDFFINHSKNVEMYSKFSTSKIF